MTHDPSAFITEYFQIRPGDTDALNDAFTSPAENVNTSIGRGLAFRIRFKVRETAAGTDTVTFKPQVKRNAGSFVDVPNYIGDANSPTAPAACVVSGQYADGDAITTRRLTNVSTFVNGSGHEDDAVSSKPDTGNYTLESQETELEWCFMIQAVHYNGTNLSENVSTDTLEFRVVLSDGTVFTGAYTNPVITVIDTDYYIGGTFIESSDNIGPFIREGNLYAVAEGSHRPGDPDPGDKGIVMKSTDGGKIWRSVDLANGPTVIDWDSGGAVQVGDTLHIAAETGGPSDVIYNNFRLSDHGSPDTWGNIDDELDGSTGDTGQAVAIVYRPTENDFIIFYNTNKGTNDRVTFRIGTFGSWSAPVDIDTEASTNFYLSAAVLGTTDPDLVHCFYKDDTNSEINHRTIDNLDALGTVHVIETNATATSGRFGTSRAIYWDNAGTEEVMILVFDETDEKMYSVVVHDDTTVDGRKAASDVAVSEHGAGSDRPDCDLVIDPDTKIAYMLYSDLSTRNLWIDQADNDGGWGTDEEIIDGVTVVLMKGNVFTHSSGNGGDKVLGYIYENGEFGEGYTGGIWYSEYLIEAAAGGVTMTADQGDYSYTGQTGYFLKRALQLVSDQGDYNIAGQIANLNITLPVEQGSYALTGQPADLDQGFIIVGDQGSYTLAGQVSNLNITLPVDQGSYALAGQVANLTFGFTMTADQGSYSISGQVANLLNQLVITAVQGSYALSGQVANLDHGFIIVSDQGSYSITGQAADFLQQLVMAGAQGSYALTGQVADLNHGFILVSDQGSYALNEQAANLVRALIVAVEQGSYTLSGQAANLRFGFNMLAAQGSYALTGQTANLLRQLTTADQGSYALTGQAAELLRSLLMDSVQGSYALSGLAANLNYSAGDATMIASTGFYALNEQAATLTRALIMDSAQGSYALSGQAVNLNQGFIILGAQGSYALSGQIAGLNQGFIILGNQGSYALSGQIANLNQGFIILAGQGAYTLTGQAVELSTGFVMTADQGSYAYTGQTADFIRALIISAAQGAYTLTGQPANLSTGNVLIAAQGNYALSGQDAQFLRGYVLGAAQGAYALTGQQAFLVRALIMAANQGSYSLNGQAAIPFRRILTATQGSYAYTGYTTLLDLVLAAVIDSFGTVEMYKQTGTTERPTQVGEVERE